MRDKEQQITGPMLISKVKKIAEIIGNQDFNPLSVDRAIRRVFVASYARPTDKGLIHLRDGCADGKNAME